MNTPRTLWIDVEHYAVGKRVVKGGEWLARAAAPDAVAHGAIGRRPTYVRRRPLL